MHVEESTPNENDSDGDFNNDVDNDHDDVEEIEDLDVNSSTELASAAKILPEEDVEDKKDIAVFDKPNFDADNAEEDDKKALGEPK